MNQDERNSMLIAIIDDDDSVRMALDSLLRSTGYTVRTYSRALEFLYSRDMADTQCLITDVQMPAVTGVELHEHLIAMNFNIATIFITAFPEAVAHLAISVFPVIACLAKPCDVNKLLHCIEIATANRAGSAL
jgi:FixJ family two-component response regulator